MLTFRDFSRLIENNEDLVPMYVAVRPTVWTAGVITAALGGCDVPNRCNPLDYHATVIYSRRPTKFPKLDTNEKFRAMFDKWTLFKSKDGKNVLVAKLFSSDLQHFHSRLMADLDASYDFPSYLPHVTVSYDVGDNFDVSVLAPINVALEFDSAYASMLDPE